MNATTPFVPRAGYAEIDLYAPRPAAMAIDLSDNTNRWGPSPAAVRVIAESASASLSRYPQAYSDALRFALANYVGAAPPSITTGCGSDDVLDSAIRAFGEPGDRVTIPDPSFTMIAWFARLNALAPMLVPLDADYDIDAEAMLACDGGTIYVCSPNNPTGTPATRERVEQLADRTRGVVIVDEAYAEFAGRSLVDLALARPNVLVVRTMSKAFGLAGLRVGYAVGNPELIGEVEKSRGPYKVSALAERAATAALTEDIPWMQRHAALVVENRERLTQALFERGLNPIPSSTNFVLLPLTNASTIADRMRQLGVAVRALEGMRPVSAALAASGGSTLRISVGPWEQLQAALDALDHARAECA